MAVEFRLDLPPVRETVTPEMLAAGRSAFIRKRHQLDDLWCFFEDDLASMLRAIFTAMQKARYEA